MKILFTVGLLILSNIFMTIAWYGHLKFFESKKWNNLGLIAIILISWLIALFEYFFQVPANRIGFKGNGGPFSLVQLKITQEVISLIIFSLFSLFVFKNQIFKWNNILAFIFIILAVYFIFKE